MRLFSKLSALLRVTLKRLRSQPGITLASICGLTVAVVLFQIVPLYADAVNFRILEEQLSTLGDKRRPPWSYIYTYNGSWNEDVEWEAIQPVRDYLRDEAEAAIALPLQFFVQHVETTRFRLFPIDQTTYSGNDDLGFTSFGTTTDIEAHIDLIEGTLPAVPSSADQAIEILISQNFAVDSGWQVGEQYLMLNLGQSAEGQNFIVQVAGIWQPINADDAYWFFGATSFDDLFLVPEATFSDVIAPALNREVHFALWYLVMDGSTVGTSQINRLVSGAREVEQKVDVLLPEASAFITPADSLQLYREAVSELSLLLFSINVPTIWMALAFISLVSGLAVSKQRNEIAVTRSRGGTPIQVIGMAVVESILLGVIAFVIGTILALWLTQLLGQARSFLDFSGAASVRMTLTQQALYAGILAVFLALIARVIPAIAASRHTIITYKLDQARAMTAPWWQRIWLDVILVAVAAYGFYTLRQQGSFSAGSDAVADSFQNPLLLLLPALTIFSLTLLFLRFLPRMMQLLSWAVARSDSISLLQAVRYLARSPRLYTTPLGLLVLTIGLAVFTASLARTVDLQLYDQSFYQIGADVSLVTVPPSPLGFGPQTTNNSERLFTFLPVSAYERLPAIEHAARVGNYELQSQIDGIRLSGQFMGVDPDQFNKVAYWRPDFSSYRFGTLMNALGYHANGVLVPNTVLNGTTLQLGDSVRYTLVLGTSKVEFESVVVGSFDYFPSWYSAESPLLIVGNLTNIFEVAGREFPYHVWAESSGLIEPEPFRQALNEQQLFGTYWEEARPLVSKAQSQPQRQGLFGLLSVGFITSTLLTVLGFFLYALFSLQRRTVELGVLRAVGLSRAKMIQQVACEMVLLILCGLLLGTGLGVVVSQQFIPFLQAGSEAADLAPPYLVEIAWEAITQIYILFGLLFIAALLALSWRLLRLKLFESIKLGETV